MAPSPLSMLLVVIATILLPSVAMAKEYVVGNEHGWTIGFDYTAWAADKTFHLGDVLVFKYATGKHNVFKVNGTAFQSCTIPPANEASTSGNDRIVLAIPGRKWYICGVAGHCNAGQKLVITVQPQTLPPTPAPSPAPFQHGSSPFQHATRFGRFGRWTPKELFSIFH